MMTIRKEIETLEKMFDELNNRFYNGQLPRPVIQYTNDVTNKMYGFITVNKVWQDKENKEVANYDLTICANHNRTSDAVIGTMLHEMAHLFAIINGIQDTSNLGFYHNKKYKEIAENHGLIVSKNKYGWSRTKLNDEAMNFAKSIETPAVWYNRLAGTPFEDIQNGEENEDGGGEETQEEKPAKAKWITFVCPVCGEVIKSKNPELKAICECGGRFQVKGK